MPSSREVALKAAATQLGLSPQEYRRHLDAGEKWCYRGQHWQPRTVFDRDRSRGDGLRAECQACWHVGYRRKHAGPGMAERHAMRAQVLAWCRYCAGWLPVSAVHMGNCRPHRQAADREHYRRKQARPAR